MDVGRLSEVFRRISEPPMDDLIQVYLYAALADGVALDPGPEWEDD